MRTFLALELPRPIVAYLTQVTERLSRMTPGVRWVRNEGIHITLKFFGEVEESMPDRIRQEALPVVSRTAPFRASLKEIDAFPNTRRARVVVVSLEEGVTEMRQLFEALDPGFSRLGFEREARPFLPHVTLGRKKVPAPFPDGDPFPLERKEFMVEQAVLFKSTLTPGGAVYAPLWKIKLGGETDEG